MSWALRRISISITMLMPDIHLWNDGAKGGRVGKGGYANQNTEWIFFVG
jgi:hypothetical protein